MESPRTPKLSKDSLELVIPRRIGLISELSKIRNKKLTEFANQARIIIRTNVANLSSAQVAILEPCLLKILEPAKLEIPLKLYGYTNQLTFFGVEMSMGSPTTTIVGHSTADINFSTATAKDLGKDWVQLQSVLDGSQFQARILFYTADGKIVESDIFPFSKNFADRLNKDRLAKLKGHD